MTKVSDEGVIIELFDLDDSPLFEGETATPTPLLQEFAETISSALTEFDATLAVEGFVKSVPIVTRDNPVWDLSLQRASAMRKLLESAGTSPTRFQRVTGHADREPVTENRMSTRNNRIEIILLWEEQL